MIVLLTGANGFIGMHLARHLAAEGLQVVAAVRRPGELADRAAFADTVRFALGDPVDRPILRGVDAVVHLAHDFTPGSSGANFAGTEALMRQAWAAGVSYQVYVSSYSAREDAVSEYGRTKWAIENLCVAAGCAAVRPGLVIGNGGLFGRLAAAVARFPILPVPSTGSAPIPAVSARDLAAAIAVLLHKQAPGTFNLYYQQATTLKSLVARIAHGLGVKRAILTVPSTPLLWALRAATVLRIPLPATPDNLLGLVRSPKSMPRADLPDLLDHWDTLDDAIRRAVLPTEG